MKSTSVNIAMVGSGSPPSTFIQRHIDGLVRKGMQVTPMGEIRSLRRLRLGLLRLGHTWQLPPQMKQTIAGADLVHFQWPGHLIAYGRLAKQMGKPIVVSLRGRQINILPLLPNHSRYVAALRDWLPVCEGYHCVSEAILKEAQAYGVAPDRAAVIRPAIDTSFFHPGPVLRAENLIVLMVGALIWRKGYEYALLAFRELLRKVPAARLRIVGEGNEKDRVEYTAADLGIERSVELKGKLNSAGIRSELRNSDIFLHSSLSEGIANVALEAMSCGLPVVSTHCGGMHEVIDHGKNGLLVPPRDGQSMAEALIYLAGSSTTRQQLGAAARERAVRQFDYSDQASQFVALYERILQRHENFAV